MEQKERKKEVSRNEEEDEDFPELGAEAKAKGKGQEKKEQKGVMTCAQMVKTSPPKKKLSDDEFPPLD